MTATVTQIRSDDEVLSELAEVAHAYRGSRVTYEEKILSAYERGLGATAIATAIGNITEAGVRMLVKRMRARGGAR
jgi:hypothetical protein